MFNNAIVETPLTNAAANSYFTEITELGGGVFDGSMLATARALLAPRMNDVGSLQIIVENRNMNYSDGRGYDLSSVFCDDYLYHNNTLYIVNAAYSTGCQTEAMISSVKNAFLEKYDGWHEVERVSNFFKKLFNVTCFINLEIKSTVLFTDRLDLRKYHFLQIAMPAFLPFFFNTKPTSEEVDFLETFKSRSSKKYLEYLEKVARNYNFKESYIRNALAGFECAYERGRIKSVESSLMSNGRTIEEYNRKIMDLLAARRELDIELTGLKSKVEQRGETSDIMRYFINNPNLELHNVSGEYMLFGTRQYMAYFDEDDAQRIIDNPGSFIVTCQTGEISSDDMRLLMIAIFIDQSVRLRFCAKYSFRIGVGVEPEAHSEFGPEYDGYMPNPHINNWSCMGNYKPIINEMIRDNNYIGALEQCIASCRSLNLHDYTVMDTFMENMYRSRIKCIELPNGEVVDSKTAIKYLKENDE